MPPPIAPLAREIEAHGHILIYGPAATGKTHLAHDLFMHAESLGLDPVIIATEPGTLVYLEHVGNARHVVARTLDEMAATVAREASLGRLPIVDSINWHYRERPGIGGARLLAFAASVLRDTGGVSVAQVSGPGEPSGAPFLIPYATLVARTSRTGDRFELHIIRPVRRIALFRPSPKGGVEWL